MKTELSTRQADTYDLLERDVCRLEQTPGKVDQKRLLRVYQLGAELHAMCAELETALQLEDERLRTDGTTDDLDARWIKNLRRLETMRDLLTRAKTTLPGMAVAA
jgi:hypothetical protein